MQFFSGTNSNGFDVTTGRDSFGNICKAHAGNLGHEYLSTVHLLDAAHHKAHALLQGQPKSGHARVGKSDTTATALLQKNRNHAPTATDNIAIAGAAEA